MADADPANREEWTERFHRSHHVVGSGLNTETHLPCPFCAAPGFQVLSILTAEEDMQREATCPFCGRSGKTIFHIGDDEFEFVQTGGEDPPP